MGELNTTTLRTWYELFHPEGDTVEIRVLDGKKTWSGYYQSAEAVINAILSVQSGGIYSCLNAIKPSCYSRSQSGKLLMSPKATTNDNDIEGRRWILVDLDPKRSSDTNSTDAEKQAARQVMTKVGIFLRDQGFESPIVADSGNGWHLYYAVKLANTDDNLQLVKDFLQVLDMLFSDDTTDIDTSVFNASRIVKVIGTRSNKGADTPDRPQRMSSFVKIPHEIRHTKIDYIRKVADMLPKREAPSMANNFNERFDLDGFITQHGIQVEKRSTFKGGTKFVLHECPFDSNHKAPDAAIFQMLDGSFGFKCLHNSCSHQIVNWANGMRSSIEQRVGEQPSAEILEAPEMPEVSETPEVTPQPVNPWMDDSQRKFTEFQRDEIVGQDSRLAWVAKKRYGEKAYWVFIYEVNRNQLNSPDYVLPGMQLRVPKLPKELSDPNDPETKALLERLSKKYLNR